MLRVLKRLPILGSADCNDYYLEDALASEDNNHLQSKDPKMGSLSKQVTQNGRFVAESPTMLYLTVDF